VEVGESDIRPYRGLVESDVFNRLMRLADRLGGLKVAYVSSVPVNDIVGQGLKSLVPLMNDLGVETTWYSITPNAQLLAVLNNLHSALEGGNWQVDSRSHQAIASWNREIAKDIQTLDVDVCFIHDLPYHPIGSAGQGRQAIWHCHLDTSAPNRAVWNYLARYLNEYDRLVFCFPQYANGMMQTNQVRFLRPAIDPLALKNQRISDTTARELLRGLDVDCHKPLISQLGEFDTRRDPMGAIDAYRLAKREIHNLQLALVGTFVGDKDSNVEQVLDMVEDYREGDPDIHVFSDSAQLGELEFNAFETASDVVLHKSMHDGFSLSAAEAMWRETRVIGGSCGGIRVLVEHGETGYLVDSPTDCARRVVELIRNRQLRLKMGVLAKKAVARNYLMPRLLKESLELIEEVVLGI